MKSVQIKLDTAEAVKKFVNITARCDYELTLKSGNWIWTNPSCSRSPPTTATTSSPPSPLSWYNFLRGHHTPARVSSMTAVSISGNVITIGDGAFL